MKRYSDFLDRLSRFVDREIIIWGNGVNGKKLQSILVSQNKRIKYVVDSRISESAKDPKVLIEEDKTRCVVVVSALHIPYVKEINSLLDTWGYENNVNYINIISDDDKNEYSDITYFDPFLGFSNKLEKKEEISSNIPKVVILGNCTSVKIDKYVWVDRVEEALTNKAIVINEACVGYSSAQELLKLIRDIVLIKPQLVICLNGVIDATGNNMNQNNPFYTNFEVNILNHIFSDLESIRYNGMQKISSTVMYGKTSEHKPSEFYYRNMQMIAGITDIMGIHFRCMLQPSLYAKNNNSLSDIESDIFETINKNEEAKFQYDRAHLFYEELMRMNKQNVEWFIDCTDIFDDCQDVYEDEFHYTEKGQRILGDYVMNIIQEQGLI